MLGGAAPSRATLSAHLEQTAVEAFGELTRMARDEILEHGGYVFRSSDGQISC